MTKYVLLRPEGGLNDIFCRIEICARYALMTGRTLLVDTLTTGFGESFANYFHPKHSSIKLLKSADELANLSQLTIYPEPSAGLLKYKPVYKEGKNYLDSETEIPLQFELTHHYHQDLLLYHGCGGGPWGHLGFLKFEIDEVMKYRVIDAMAKMPHQYVAVHLRATDLKTDYVGYLRHIKPHLVGKDVYVATDSAAALSTAIQELDGCSVHNFSTTLSMDGRPLHMFNELDEKTWDRSVINAQTIIDLMILSRADEFYYSVTADNMISGFSMLAMNLQKQGKETDTVFRTN
jgi:hypothetical protein